MSALIKLTASATGLVRAFSVSTIKTVDVVPAVAAVPPQTDPRGNVFAPGSPAVPEMAFVTFADDSTVQTVETLAQIVAAS